MRLACTQENLAQGLTLVSHVTGKNVNLPILGNVLLKTENGNLKLSATNLEMAVSCLVRGKIEVEGEYSVPAKLLLDYVALLPSGKVDLTLQEEGLEIVSNGQETVMRGMPASEFPLLPKLTKQSSFKMTAADIRRALGQVAFAASTSESRPELTGVSCVFGDREGKPSAVFAATDSYRLAERVIPLTGPVAQPVKAIVPVRAILEISRIVTSYNDEMTEAGDVLWSFTDNQLVVTYGNVEIVTRLIEGGFPAYEEIIPKNFKTEAILPRAALHKAVRAASLFSRQGLFDVKMLFDPEKGTCDVASADQGMGKTKTAIAGKVTGEMGTVTLNYRYVMDGLAALPTDNVRIAMIDQGNPILILPADSTEQYRYLVMPIRQ